MLVTIGISLIVAAAATCEITFVECISAQNCIDEKEKSSKIHVHDHSSAPHVSTESQALLARRETT